MTLPDVRPIVVASHPRSGTHLTIDLLRKHFADCDSWKWPGERNDHLYINLDQMAAIGGTLSEGAAWKIARRTSRPIVKTHAGPGREQGVLPERYHILGPVWHKILADRARWLYVWRDPEPVLCSYYLFSLQAKRISSSTSLSAFVRGDDLEGASRARDWNDHVLTWISRPGVLTIGFDGVIHKTASILEGIGEHLGATPLFRNPILPKQFSTRWSSRRARLLRMKPESTAIVVESRIDWRSALTEDDKEHIAQETVEARAALRATA